MPVLYGRGQSRSFRVLWALEEANIPFEYREVEFGSEGLNGTISKKYRSLNSQGKIPTLVDNDLVITESAAILNYIAAKNPSSNLIPENDLVQRTLYDQICFFVLSELEQPLWTNGKHQFALPKEQRISTILEVTHWEFNKSLQALIPYIQGKKYAVGDVFTMADILIAHTLNWADRSKFKVPREFLTYRDDMYHRPACKKALLKTE